MPLYDDACFTSLPFDQLLTHTCMYRDAIRETWRVYGLRDIDQVHIYIYENFDSYCQIMHNYLY